jgi:hypothetical protein
VNENRKNQRFELRLPAAFSGLVRVTPSGSKRPILSWRTAQAIDRIPIWAAGDYRVSIGNKVFASITAQTKG